MANHRGPIPDWLTSSYMEDILRIGLARPELFIADIDVTAGSNIGDNYACQIFRIKVNLKSGETMSIIGKYKPKLELLENLKLDFDIFEVESRYLQKLVPIMGKIIGSSSIWPKCIGVDHEHSIFFMEDLKEQDFVLQNRELYLSKEQCVLVVKALALVHGASFCVVKQDPTIKDKYPEGFWNGTVKEPIKKWYENAQRNYKQVVNTYGLSERHAHELLNIMDRVNGDFCKVCEFQSDHLNFLLHGDAWKSNMMFHFTDNKPDAVKLLDFQIVNYNCFANDLQYFIFSSAQSSVILNNLDEILEIYFEQLRTVAPDIPGCTLERIKKEFAERYTFGYMIATCMRPLALAPTPPDYDDIWKGNTVDCGYSHPEYMADILKFMPFFEKVGVLNYSSKS